MKFYVYLYHLEQHSFCPKSKVSVLVDIPVAREHNNEIILNVKSKYTMKIL